MIIRYASDLHLEFYDNRQWLRLQPLEGKGGLLLLAGDIMPFTELGRLREFYARWGDQYDHVLWVPGNHEYYGGDINERSGRLDEKLTSNVRLLNDEVWYAPGLRILCTTLWTPIAEEDEVIMQNHMADYSAILDNGHLLKPRRTSALHAASLAWLRSELAKPFEGHTVVVTHHVPTFRNYPPEFEDSALSGAFAVDLDDLVVNSGAYAWIYGHHHRNIPAFELGNTRMLTNQLGYLQEGEGTGFGYRVHLDLTTE